MAEGATKITSSCEKCAGDLAGIIEQRQLLQTCKNIFIHNNQFSVSLHQNQYFSKAGDRFP
jgi:hypothetical protein